MKLIGKTREELAELLRNTRREELLDLIYKYVTCEPHYTDRQIAALRHIGVAKVRKVVRPAHKQGRTNPWTFPLSAIRRYDAQTAVTLSNGS